MDFYILMLLTLNFHLIFASALAFPPKLLCHLEGCKCVCFIREKKDNW